MRLRVFAWLIMALTAAGAPNAKADCSRPMPDAVSRIPVPGNPFSAIPSRDGCMIFISLPGGRLSQILVLGRDDGRIVPLRSVPAEGQLTGMTLSPDGRYLAAVTGDGVAIFDAVKLARGANDARLASADDGPHAGSIYARFTSDQHLLFVANERSASLSVYDVSDLPQRLREIGHIPVGVAPVGLAFSQDGRYLYSTSEIGPRAWPAKCTSEGPVHPEGLLAVIDVAKASTDPSHAVVDAAAAGCNPVRTVLAPEGAILYVTARGDNMLEAFDAGKLLGDPQHARIGAVRVGTSPVGVIAVPGKVIVTNSNRFAGGDNQTLSVLKAADLSAESSIPAGGFPREFALTPDGNTLLLTNFLSRDLELIDLGRLDQVVK